MKVLGEKEQKSTRRRRCSGCKRMLEVDSTDLFTTAVEGPFEESSEWGFKCPVCKTVTNVKRPW